jgi:hypothetical protein
MKRAYPFLPAVPPQDSLSLFSQFLGLLGLPCVAVQLARSLFIEVDQFICTPPCLKRIPCTACVWICAVYSVAMYTDIDHLARKLAKETGKTKGELHTSGVVLQGMYGSASQL